jgi:L-aminopeptidase/D-esterase-like protein
LCWISVFLLGLTLSVQLFAQPRGRDLGIPFEGSPGRWNAITDVAGVEVGMTTIIEGKGKLVVGQGPVRTGVTVVFPRGKRSASPCFASWWTLNGNGEMTGTTWIEESGLLAGPVAITNTHSVGAVHEAVIAWSLVASDRWGSSYDFSLPVVAETWDGFLNDINGFHVKRHHVFAALDGASSGPVSEGNVGGGTGMISFGFKGGTGTASRKLDSKSGGYTVGVLVQANFGRRRNLSITGVPVGQEISGPLPTRGAPQDGSGSIIVVVATDAPLLPHQLKRLATRAGLGVGVTGGRGEDSSGDIFLAFSTASPGSGSDSVATILMLSNNRMNPLFEATVQATEEAIVNAMVAARTMEGVNENTVQAIPHERLREILKKYGRLKEN